MNDWAKMIEYIVSDGWTVEEIAQRCGCSRTALSDVRSGRTRQPIFDTANALLLLHKKVTRKRARK